MLRAGAVAVGASIVAALAVIALLMGLFVEMPTENPAANGSSCGHVLDRAYRHGPTRPGCASPLRKRRYEVAAAAGVAGSAMIVGVTAMAKSLGSST